MIRPQNPVRFKPNMESQLLWTNAAHGQLTKVFDICILLWTFHPHFTLKSIDFILQAKQTEKYYTLDIIYMVIYYFNFPTNFKTGKNWGEIMVMSD